MRLLAALLILCAATGSTRAQPVTATVGVYGSTVCAVAACVAAARMGASCAIVESQAHLFGMTSGGLSGVDLNMPLGGIALEIFGPRPGPNHPPHVLNATLWALIKSAGPGVVSIFTRAGAITRVDRIAGGPRIGAVHFEGGTPPLVLTAEVFLDCSYEGDLLRLSNTSFAVGRESAREFNESRAGVNANQPWAASALPLISPWVDNSNTTLLPQLAPLPQAAPGDADDLVQTYNYRLCLTNNASNRLPLLPPANYTPASMEALRRWFIVNASYVANHTLMDNELLLIRHLGESKVDVNQHFMPCASDLPFLQRAYPLAGWPERAEIAARHEWWTRAVWEFLRTDAVVPPAMRAEAGQWGLPADEFLETGGFPPQLYIRESIRMRGARVLRQQDVLGAEYSPAEPTSVGLSKWLVDVHVAQRVALPPELSGRGWEVADAGGTSSLGHPWQLTEIPYEALTPQRAETQNLLVPVCASFTHIAFATYRLEPQYAVFGHSAGVAAVLAARAGCAVQDLGVPALQAELRAQGQLLDAQPPSPTPPPDDAPLRLAPCANASAAQAWAWLPADGSLRLALGGDCASIFAFSNASGARLVAARCHTDDPQQPANQAFDVVPAQAGALRLRSRMSQLCIASAADTPGAALVQGDCAGVEAQWEGPFATPGGEGPWSVAPGGKLCVAV